LSELAQAGIALLEKLSGMITQDPVTGEQYLRLPVPKPEMIQKLGEVISALSGTGGAPVVRRDSNGMKNHQNITLQ